MLTAEQVKGYVIGRLFLSMSQCREKSLIADGNYIVYAAGCRHAR